MAGEKKAAAPKKGSAAPTHGSYKDMIKTAIVNLKERTGSSRQAIKKYVRSNNNLGATTDAAFDKHINHALAAGEKSGEFERPKGPSGPTKLAKKGDKKPESAAKPAATKAKKPATAKTTTAKKPAAKKTDTKKTTTKTATKTKANSAKPRKTATKPGPAPAVEKKEPVTLHHTKSGRVSKSAQPQTGTKKAAPKKTATKKAAPKKSTTPKKAEAAPKKAET